MNDNSKGNMKINGFIKNVFGGTDIYNASTKNTNQGAGSTETQGRKEDVEQKFQDNQKSVVYNLIILDESGSMSGVTGQTIHGCNETFVPQHVKIRNSVSSSQSIALTRLILATYSRIYRSRRLEI